VIPQEDEIIAEEEIVEELTEEELLEMETQRLNEEENMKISQDFDNYVELDADAEAKKIHSKVMEKKVKKAEIHLLDPMPRSYEQRHAGNKSPCGKPQKGTTHYLAQAGSRNYF